jgi:hypothetical protein
VPNGWYACPQPQVEIAVWCQNRKTNELRFDTHSFLIDTGAHVTLMSHEFAHTHKVVGYDSTKPLVLFAPTFSGALLGRWGQLEIRVGGVRRPIPCFFYTTEAPRRRGFWRWLRSFYEFAQGVFSGKPEPHPEKPLLGRAGVLDTSFYSTIFDRHLVGMSDQSFLEPD